MTHHTWKHRFTLAFQNRNWKKIILHDFVEYSWLGGWYLALEGDPIFWPIGIAGALIIHFVVFEALDALHKENVTHKWIPSWLHWMFEDERTKRRSKN